MNHFFNVPYYIIVIKKTRENSHLVIKSENDFEKEKIDHQKRLLGKKRQNYLNLIVTNLLGILSRQNNDFYNNF